jgi:hypothetical protein
MTNIAKPAFKYNGYIVSATDAPLYVKYMDKIITDFNNKCVMGVCLIDLVSPKLPDFEGLKFEYIEDALIELSYEDCDKFICEMGLRNALKLYEDNGFDEIPLSEMKELNGIWKFMFGIMFSCIEINDDIGITMVEAIIHAEKAKAKKAKAKKAKAKKAKAKANN